MANIAKISEGMTNSKELLEEIVSQITLNEDTGEKQAIALLLFEKATGMDYAGIQLNRNVDRLDRKWLQQALQRVNQLEPVQYVTGLAHFLGRVWKVNPAVLIPRPETEELVVWLRDYLNRDRKKKKPIRVLDIGTGSGCIAISLALNVPGTEVTATDNSEDALQTAAENAKMLGAQVQWLHHDILKDALPADTFDVVVSNPPYIHPSEVSDMQQQVWAHEPHEALFAPAENPLLFYQAIAGKAMTTLKQGGCLATEINAKYGAEVRTLFVNAGLHHVTVHQDINAKDRFVTAER